MMKFNSINILILFLCICTQLLKSADINDNLEDKFNNNHIRRLAGIVKKGKDVNRRMRNRLKATGIEKRTEKVKNTIKGGITTRSKWKGIRVLHDYKQTLSSNFINKMQILSPVEISTLTFKKILCPPEQIKNCIQDRAAEIGIILEDCQTVIPDKIKRPYRHHITCPIKNKKPTITGTVTWLSNKQTWQWQLKVDKHGGYEAITDSSVDKFGATGITPKNKNIILNQMEIQGGLTGMNKHINRNTCVQTKITPKELKRQNGMLVGTAIGGAALGAATAGAAGLAVGAGGLVLRKKWGQRIASFQNEQRIVCRIEDGPNLESYKLSSVKSVKTDDQHFVDDAVADDEGGDDGGDDDVEL